MKSATSVVLWAVLLFGAAVLCGCACESQTVRLNPVWSATVPEYGVEYSKTTNVFPFYSKNVTVYNDRIEETGNTMLLFSWSKTTMRTPGELPAAEAIPAEAVSKEPAEEAAVAQPVDEETREQLKALGYLGDDAPAEVMVAPEEVAE